MGARIVIFLLFTLLASVTMLAGLWFIHQLNIGVFQ